MQLDRMVSVWIPKAELFAYCYLTNLVNQHVECPRQEEADPSDGHHDPHLGRGQLVRDPVDVNQLHVGLDAQLCGDGQPGKTNSKYCEGENYFLLNIYPRLSTTNIRKYRDCLMNVGSCPTLLLDPE